jgi:hypothetical protein
MRRIKKVSKETSKKQKNEEGNLFSLSGVFEYLKRKSLKNFCNRYLVLSLISGFPYKDPVCTP